MMRVTWEVPAVRDLIAAWLREVPHGRAPGMRRLGAWASHGLVFESYEAVYDREDYIPALNALVALNLAWLRRFMSPNAPDIVYAPGMRYAAECCGEVWRSYPALLCHEAGDCEDLAAARVAELRRRGVAAMIDLVAVGGKKWHVRVRMPDGTVEDPAEELRATRPSAACDPVGPMGQPCQR